MVEIPSHNQEIRYVRVGNNRQKHKMASPMNRRTSRLELGALLDKIYYSEPIGLFLITFKTSK